MNCRPGLETTTRTRFNKLFLLSSMCFFELVLRSVIIKIVTNLLTKMFCSDKMQGTCVRLNSSGSIKFYFLSDQVASLVDPWEGVQSCYFSLFLLLLEHTGDFVLDHVDLNKWMTNGSKGVVYLLLNFGNSKSAFDHKSDPDQGDDRALSAEVRSRSEDWKSVRQEFDGSISLNRVIKRV